MSDPRNLPNFPSVTGLRRVYPAIRDNYTISETTEILHYANGNMPLSKKALLAGALMKSFIHPYKAAMVLVHEVNNAIRPTLSS